MKASEIDFVDPLSEDDIVRLLRITNASDLGIHRAFVENLERNTGVHGLQQLSNRSTQDYMELIAGMAEETYNIPAMFFKQYSPVVIPSVLFHAETLSIDSRTRIVIHEGLLSWLSFVTETIVLQQSITRYGKDDELALNAVKFISDARIRLSYSYFNDPSLFPRLSTYLHPEDQAQGAGLLFSMELFVILHEMSHARLGHLCMSGSNHIVNNIVAIVPEEFSLTKARELEADLAAFDFVRHARAPRTKWGPNSLLIGAVHLLGALAMYDNFSEVSSSTHPHSLNRLENLRVSAQQLNLFTPDQIEFVNHMAAVVAEDYREMPKGAQLVSKQWLNMIDPRKTASDLALVADAAAAAFFS